MAFENDFEIGPSDTPSRGFNRVAIVAEIHAERDRQDAQWGGPEHDDQHTPDDWFLFIEDQTDHYCDFIRDKKDDAAVVTAAARKRLIKIAALAIAAVESIDRKRSPR